MAQTTQSTPAPNAARRPKRGPTVPSSKAKPGGAPQAKPDGNHTAGAAKAKTTDEKAPVEAPADAATSTNGAAKGDQAKAATPAKTGGGLFDRIARGVTSRVPRADLDQRDPDFIRDLLPGAWLLATLWHRADVRSLDRIPESGPVLLVGNHSGGNVSPDTLVFTLAFESYFGVERPFYQLAHNLVVSAPHLSWLRKFGTVAASHSNSEQALQSGAALLVYPGGDREVHRPSWESARVDFGGRTGFVRLALAHNVPIVPVVSIGGQETALFLSRGEQLAKLLGIDRLLRLKVMPISIALPWGVNVGDLFTHFPLPAKITMQVLDPIDLRAKFGPDPDVDVVYQEVVDQMQECLSDLAAHRRFPVLG
jgi:1-acyl-sn-glycerol-3-phosphate acyltransferase